jgi:hypothetical protein
MHTIEYHLATKNEIISFSEKWMKLKIILLSKIDHVFISYTDSRFFFKKNIVK